ncbi:hypothetical protein IFM89_036164 [Coptis chinensis]|uniref:Uncharacterized protein n=1 Tax=Coptis chinensis TaxID=261450 RepID=A0A835H2Q1_9MAGN|nr:hypothetical protein IFM89_036164 [Coptis chinensis]
MAGKLMHAVWYEGYGGGAAAAALKGAWLANWVCKDLNAKMCCIFTVVKREDFSIKICTSDIFFSRELRHHQQVYRSASPTGLVVEIQGPLVKGVHLLLWSQEVAIDAASFHRCWRNRKTKLVLVHSFLALGLGLI